jgi:hypothetical protein
MGARHRIVQAPGRRRRHYPGQKIEPLRSAEPAPVSDTEREQLHPAPDGMFTETSPGIRDLATQRQASNAEIDERPLLMPPGEDPVWGDLGRAFSAWQASGRDVILQPPKPEIIPSARILHNAGERDTERDHEAAD